MSNQSDLKRAFRILDANKDNVITIEDFDKIEMVPVPHRNTINFLGMQTKNNYLIWRESNGVLTALDKKGDLQAWVIGTGKTIKPEVTQSNIDFKEFELY